MMDRLRFLDTDPIVDIDDCAVAGERTTVTAIIAPHHAYAGIVPVEHWAAIGRLSPWRIAETYALALRARCADEFEIIGRGQTQNPRRITAPGEGQPKLAAIRVRSAQWFLGAIWRDHAEIVEKHLAMRVARILLDIGDAYPERLAPDS